ncbi:hypothetical protein CAEBREN_11951 [Caenorhabditis brenneri]|uniref:DNA2/NAM7 helicase-like C-terminal domain-containing protein n=1 Tax=Caenorhabditis brenneri TaxID=135651 RepID=G0MCY6_CAEBE|nr:hypothetical protein CAEBREN_11951 [Caenorhabditis brenneri]
MSEREQNVLSEYYVVPYKKKEKDEVLSEVQEELQRYTHNDAIKFAEQSLNYKVISFTKFPVLPKNDDYKIKPYRSFSGVFAYYRVVAEKPDRYILSACHANIHGYHRGDLRFLEVNNRTKSACSEQFSVIGKLYLGDIVAVGGLASLREFESLDSRDVSPESDPVWMATWIYVLTRDIRSKVTFSLLNPADQTAVVKDHNELMTINHSCLQADVLYYGDAFFPEKIRDFFTDDHHPDLRNRLINKCSKIHQPSNPYGTIFAVYTSKALSEIFDIGQTAFNKPSVYGNEASKIVESCVLMGYSAANALQYGRLDARDFPMRNTVRNGRILEFYIDNPFKNPTEGKWGAGNQIEIGGRTGKDSAVIETAIAEKRLLKISARLSRDVPKHIRFDKGLYIASQREPQDIKILRDGFYKELPDFSNGQRILQTLYGAGLILKRPVVGFSYSYESEQATIKLNPYQAEYVEMIKDPYNPIIIGSSPFGCGKSMTIVTAAMEMCRDAPSTKQLLVTQSNFASVNLVEIASKMKNGFRFIRFISEKNTKRVADDCLTDYDLPVMTKKVFTEWALGKYQVEGRRLEEKHYYNMLNLLLNENCVEPHELVGQAQVYYEGLRRSKYPNKFLIDQAFFRLYSPQVIMTTADSLHTLLSYNILPKNSISTIQIDEASQLPEHTFIGLLARFPNANYGLIGDIKQLPPFCETGLEGKLKDYGIGNTMERAVAGNLFPQAMLREVYRCHPRTTAVLSELFYDGKLVPGVLAKDRDRFMFGRSDFWPNPQSPFLVVNNPEKGKKMGTSCGNTHEKDLVMDLLKVLTADYNGYKLQESDIGIISFYKAQTSVLTDALRKKGVKCGTVDSFQGSEKEVIILCCTNETITDFMQDGNRLNVAMSRAKQATIIVGNLAGLKEAKYWKRIVGEAVKYGCVVTPDSSPNRKFFELNGLEHLYYHMGNMTLVDKI